MSQSETVTIRLLLKGKLEEALAASTNKSWLAAQSDRGSEIQQIEKLWLASEQAVWVEGTEVDAWLAPGGTEHTGECTFRSRPCRNSFTPQTILMLRGVGSRLKESINALKQFRTW